jgi:hypothetical protein
VPHWGYIIGGTICVHSVTERAEYTAGETYYWAPGRNLEAVADIEYFETSKVGTKTC